MKTEDIEYNGRIFSCRTIIDISTMVELLGLLAKRQKYLEDKINFQEERINDKDKRISELEIRIKGFSLSKEEKFPLEKEIPSIKNEIKNDLDEDDLDLFLSRKENDESKTIYLENDNDKDKDEHREKDAFSDSNEVKTVELDEKSEEKEEENTEKKVEDKKEEKVEEKNEEKVDDKKEKKVEEKVEEQKEEKKEEKPEEKNEIKSDEDNNIPKKEEETEKKIDINLEQKQTPTIIKQKNLVETENKQISSPENTEKKEVHFTNNNNTNNNNNEEKNNNQNQNENIIHAPTTNTQTDEIIKKIIKRIKLLESKIDALQQSELAAKSQNINTEKANKSKLDSKVNLLNKKVEQIEEDQNKMKEEMAKIKDKVDDFNVYDMFKGNSGDTNIDAAKALIMALENKIFKKLGFYDLKFKKDEEDIFQNKSDIKNMNNLINNLKEVCDKNTKDIQNLKDNSDNKYAEINTFISDIKNKMEEIGSKINKNAGSNNNIGNNGDENNPDNNASISNNDISKMKEKIKELENKIGELNNNLELIKSHSNNNDSSEQNAANQEQLKFIKDINSRTHELEKQMKIILSQLNIKEVYERLDNIEKDLIKKGTKYEINELKDVIQTLEENEKDLNFKMDQMQQFSEKLRGDMQQIIKKIEYLSGQLNRISNENADNEKGKGPIIDVNKFVDMFLFNEKQKEINKKFDKIRLSFEEVARNIDDILQKLSHVPTDKDFSQFQSIIKTMVDDLKLSLNKKYAEKSETTKSIKFLETQIKSIQDSFQKKMDGADNWLLAKKPLNNYVCASCESIIRGELDKRSEFVPWNKYPNREEKSYRYGHGFSRMLQLINEDRKKEIKEKDSMSDGGSDSEPNFKLPKLKRLHINSGKLKNNNNNFMSDDENNVPFEKNIPTQNEMEHLPTEEKPKIMKIFKKNKNANNSGYLNRLDKIREKDKENNTNAATKILPNNQKEGNQNAQNENNIVNNNE